MTFVSVTRLRIRSLRFLPAFALDTLRTRAQVAAAQGFRGGSLLPDRSWTFWTLTAWDSQEDMRRYMTTGPHRAAMPKLLHWCDEASVVHWTQAEPDLPGWAEADRRMREEGRPSKVRHPSADHAASRSAGLVYRPPRTSRAGPIQPRRAG